ncbi:MAG: AMP-binding protein [Pseudomonadota bacterium]
MSFKLQTILAYKSLQGIVVYQQNRAITLQQIISDVIYLDNNLPQHKYLLNLYENRYYFLLGLLVAIKRNSIHLFPSNIASYTLDYLEQKYQDILLLNDSKADKSHSNKSNFIDIKILLKEKNQKNNKPETAKQLEQFLNSSCIDKGRIIIFTSGSTGEPKPFIKKWSDFIAVARQMVKLIDIQNNPMVLATVPAQHMYGLETSIIMPLVNGLGLYEQRPFYPADIESILSQQTKPSLLITTPIHLRACLKTQQKLPFLQTTISATAPLDCKTAKEFETTQQTSLAEVYGCTEVGIIAMRQPAHSQQWLCLADIKIKQAVNKQYYIQTKRSIQSFILNDYISDVKDNKFLLNGRKADIINLAGKRTSLAYLNHHLLSSDLLMDGCFYQPEASDDPHQRLVIFIVLDHTQVDSQVTIKELKKYLQNRMDSVFLPRHYYCIKQLPRNKTGKMMYKDIKNLYYKLKK